MKKVKYLILFCFLTLCLTACQNTKEEQKENNNDNNVNEKVEGNNNMNENNNSIVIYFSATGTTETVAKKIANVTNSDIKEIIPTTKYTDADLNYGNDNSRANKEQNDDSARPEIENNIDTTKYDIIYLGYPIWWGDIPKVILTFLDTHALEGKTVIPFCTSGSTGISQSQNTLESYNKNINWLKGRRLSSNVSEQEISNWIKELNL